MKFDKLFDIHPIFEIEETLEFLRDIGYDKAYMKVDDFNLDDDNISIRYYDFYLDDDRKYFYWDSRSKLFFKNNDGLGGIGFKTVKEIYERLQLRAI